MEDFDKNPRWYQRPILALFCDRIWAKKIRCFVWLKSQHRQRWKRPKRSNDIIQHGRGDLIVNCPLYKAHPPPAHPHSWDNLSTSPSNPLPILTSTQLSTAHVIKVRSGFELLASPFGKKLWLVVLRLYLDETCPLPNSPTYCSLQCSSHCPRLPPFESLFVPKLYLIIVIFFIN